MLNTSRSDVQGNGRSQSADSASSPLPAPKSAKLHAYNLTLAMQQALNPKDRATVHTAETIRRMWFLLPAVVANHARDIFLRLPREAEHGHYGRAVRALEALTAGTGT